MEYITLEIPAQWSPHANRIQVIKSIREFSGLGLKEAKDVTDQPGQHRISYAYMKTRAGSGWHINLLNECISNMQAAGIAVKPSAYGILDDLKRLSKEALDIGELDLANEILQLLLADRLRRPN